MPDNLTSNTNFVSQKNKNVTQSLGKKSALKSGCNLMHAFKEFQFSKDKAGKPQLVLVTKNPFHPVRNQLIEKPEQLPSNEQEIYAAFDSMLNYLKKIGLCDNQHNLPVEQVAYFYDSELKLEVKFHHADIDRSQFSFLNSDVKPVKFCEYGIKGQHIFIRLDENTFTPQFQEILSSELNSLINGPYPSSTLRP